jgi:membrane protease YdiL (CAAX protease family)
VNDSTSQTSPAWPTRWPKGSFSPWWTVGFIALLVWVVFLAFVASTFAALLYLVSTHHYAELRAVARNPAAMGVTVFTVSTTSQLLWEAVGAVVILLGVQRLTHLSLRQLGFRMPTAQTVLYALVGTVAMVVVADVGASVISHFFPHVVHPEVTERIFEHIRKSVTGISVFAAYAIVLQPIAEEMLFRIFIFNLALRYGGFWPGALISGFLFGITHYVTGSADFVSGLLLGAGGVILCWVYYRSRNAYASMITHGLFNAVSLVTLYFAPKLAGG